MVELPEKELGYIKLLRSGIQVLKLDGPNKLSPCLLRCSSNLQRVTWSEDKQSESTQNILAVMSGRETATFRRYDRQSQKPRTHASFSLVFKNSTTLDMELEADGAPGYKIRHEAIKAFQWLIVWIHSLTISQGEADDPILQYLLQHPDHQEKNQQSNMRLKNRRRSASPSGGVLIRPASPSGGAVSASPPSYFEDRVSASPFSISPAPSLLSPLQVSPALSQSQAFSPASSVWPPTPISPVLNPPELNSPPPSLPGRRSSVSAKEVGGVEFAISPPSRKKSIGSIKENIPPPPSEQFTTPQVSSRRKSVTNSRRRSVGKEGEPSPSRPSLEVEIGEVPLVENKRRKSSSRGAKSLGIPQAEDEQIAPTFQSPLAESLPFTPRRKSVQSEGIPRAAIEGEKEGEEKGQRRGEGQEGKEGKESSPERNKREMAWVEDLIKGFDAMSFGKNGKCKRVRVCVSADLSQVKWGWRSAPSAQLQEVVQGRDTPIFQKVDLEEENVDAIRPSFSLVWLDQTLDLELMPSLRAPEERGLWVQAFRWLRTFTREAAGISERAEGEEAPQAAPQLPPAQATRLGAIGGMLRRGSMSLLSTIKSTVASVSADGEGHAGLYAALGVPLAMDWSRFSWSVRNVISNFTGDQTLLLAQQNRKFYQAGLFVRHKRIQLVLRTLLLFSDTVFLISHQPEKNGKYRLRTVLPLEFLRLVESPGKYTNKPLVFGLATDEKTYYLETATEDLKIHWITLIAAALRKFPRDAEKKHQDAGGDAPALARALSKIIPSNPSAPKEQESPLDSLHSAVKRGDLEEVQRFIKKGISPTLKAEDEIGSTPLHIAVMQGNSKILRGLLQVRVLDPDFPDRTGVSPLVSLIVKHTKEKAKLLADGIEDDAPDRKDKEVEDMVSALLEAQADPNQQSRGLSLIQLAARTGCDDIIGMLLDAKADICSHQPSLGPAVRSIDPASPLTPLHLAILMSSLSTIQLLCQRGAPINQPDAQGLTPLHLTSSVEVAIMLIRYGARPDIKDETGAPATAHLPDSKALIEARLSYMQSKPMGAECQSLKDLAKMTAKGRCTLCPNRLSSGIVDCVRCGHFVCKDCATKEIIIKGRRNVELACDCCYNICRAAYHDDLLEVPLGMLR